MDDDRRTGFSQPENARRSAELNVRHRDDYGRGHDVPLRSQTSTQSDRQADVYDAERESIPRRGESPSNHETHADRKMKTESQDMPRKNRITALICSIVAIIISLMYIGLGIVAIVLRLYVESTVPFVGAVTCLLQGGFGIHFSRQKSCNRLTVVTVVVTICGVALWVVFGTFAYWAGQFLGDPGYQFQFRRPDLGYISVAGACITIAALASSMVQLWIACAVTCCAEAPRSNHGATRKTVTDTENFVL